MKLSGLTFITLLSIIRLSVFAQNASTANIFTEKDSIYISGTVIGFKPGQTDNFIAFSTHDMQGKPTKHAFQLKNDGSFDARLYQPFAGDIQLNYKEAFVRIYAEPNEHLSLDILNDKINRSTGHKDAFLVKGKHAEFNNILLSFHAEFSLQDFDNLSDLGDKTQSDTTYSIRRFAQLTAELDFLNSFFKRHNINHPAFERWQKNQLTYSAAKEIIWFPFASKINREITDDKLIQLLKNIPVTSDAFNNSAYYAFLSMLAGGEEIIVNVNPAYAVAKSLNGNNSILLYINNIDKISAGLTREILYYDVYNEIFNHATHPVVSERSLNALSQAWDRFNTTVKQPYLNKLLNEKKDGITAVFKPYNIIERIKDQKVSDNLKQKLLAVFAKQKDVNLYIDFWGDWCIPCMQEMPLYPKLIAAFEGKPLNFLFFSVLTTEESMLNVRKKYNIKADFINLTKDEVAVMNNVFGFYGYPSHFIMDNTDRVISNSIINNLSESGLDQNIKLIDKLLFR
jgi:thiol-disulfide isomerase/thioredoxin